MPQNYVHYDNWGLLYIYYYIYSLRGLLNIYYYIYSLRGLLYIYYYIYSLRGLLYIYYYIYTYVQHIHIQGYYVDTKFQFHIYICSFDRVAYRFWYTNLMYNMIKMNRSRDSQYLQLNYIPQIYVHVYNNIKINSVIIML